MFVLNPLPSQLPSALIAELAQVETATVGHFLHSGFVDPAIRAVLPDKRIAGTAVTLRIPHADSTLLHHILGLVRPGDFLVIDRCGDARHACWGGVVTNTAKVAGVVGAVIDGVATDFNEVRRCEMPIWCRGPSPITTKLLGLEGAFNVPVSVGGQTVSPGDAVLADESGADHRVEAVGRQRGVVLNRQTDDVVTRQLHGLGRRRLPGRRRLDRHWLSRRV